MAVALCAVAAALLGVAAMAPGAGAAEASTTSRTGAQDGQKGRPPGTGRAGPPGARPGAGSGGKPGGKPGGGGPPMFVGVDRVLKGPLTRTEPVLGRIVATRKGVVAARVSGAVVSIGVAIGDRVKQGRILARQDIASAEARLAFETAELKLAEQELKRFEALRSNRSAAFARSRYDTAVHRVARARANVRLVRLAIDAAVVTAPYDGVVVRKATELGAYLKDGAAVVELLNDTDVEIEADVPADRLRGLQPGTVVAFRLQAGRQSTGAAPRRARVRALLPTQNMLTRTQAVRFVPLDGAPGSRFPINQALTVDVPVGAAQVAVSVHKDAIVTSGGSRLVYVVRGGRAMPRPVTLGEAVGSRFIVLAGLAPGEVTVVRGNERLRPGQPVRHRPLPDADADAGGQPGNRSPADRLTAN